MNKRKFLTQPEVVQFVNWLCENLPAMQFNLNFKASKYVTNGFKMQGVPFGEILTAYRWRVVVNGIEACDFDSTNNILSSLQENLISAIQVNDEQAAYHACCAILDWGGVPKSKPFLRAKANQNCLVQYLQSIKPLLDLNGDQHLESINSQSVESFNAGMTKVHALLDGSGSPIYDSRVGAAIAMLYAIYLQKNNLQATAILKFPSGPARGGQIRNPSDLDYEAGAPQFYTRRVTPAQWAQSQLKLGWVIQKVLENKTSLFKNQGNIVDRSRAFEAGLFVIGYDLRCFVPQAQLPIPIANEDLPMVANNNWVPAGHTLHLALNAYLQFRQQENLQNTIESFRDWYLIHIFQENGQPYTPATIIAQCFPLQESEFNLFNKTTEEVRIVTNGGEDGLRVAWGDGPFSIGDERTDVCLVDVWLTGRAYTQFNTAAGRVNWLIGAGYAGTANAANVLMYVGRKTGIHFGLLNGQFMPTELFNHFFHDNPLE